MPIEKFTEQGLRVRIRLYVLDKMAEMGWGPADVVRRTGVDKGALSKFLDPHGDAPLGLDNFARLTAGLVINANDAMHKRHPKEKRNGSDPGRPGQRSGL